MTDYDDDIDDVDDEFEENSQNDVDSASTHSQPVDSYLDALSDGTLDSPARTTAGGRVSMSTLPVTGEPRVDDALARLQDIESLPVHEHVPVYDDVRRRLHDTLSDLSGQ